MKISAIFWIWMLTLLVSEQLIASAFTNGFMFERIWVQLHQKLEFCTLDRIQECQGHCPMTCIVPGKGRASWDPKMGRAIWEPFYSGQVVGGLGVEGRILLAKGTGSFKPRILSNGFQSWSYSGFLEMPPALSLGELVTRHDHNALRSEEFRDGRGYSWEYSAALGQKDFFFIGAITAERMSSWVQFGLEENLAAKEKKESTDDEGSKRIRFFMVSGMHGDSLTLSSHEAFASEQWTGDHGELGDFSSTLTAYRKKVDLQSQHIPAKIGSSDEIKQYALESQKILGWNSWYHLWGKVTEKDVVTNLEKVKDFLTKVGTDYGGGKLSATIDDGWQTLWGEWQPNSKFSPRLEDLVEKIGGQGFETGLWLAPFLVDVKSRLIESHPEWFVKTEDFVHPSGLYKILDVTHPEVQSHLRDVFQGLKEKGVKSIKLDFLFAATFPGTRYKPVTSIEAYREGLSLIREALGDSVQILACGAPHLPTRAFVDRWRAGPDIAYEFPLNAPVWIDVAIAARNVGARAFLCERDELSSTVQKAFGCDADPWLIRGKKRKHEIQSALWVHVFPGSGLVLSDDFGRINPLKLNELILPEALQQAFLMKPAEPDYIKWSQESAPHRLYGASFFDRIFDLGAKAIHAPNIWKLEDGKKVFVNFSDENIKLRGQKVLRSRETRVF